MNILDALLQMRATDPQDMHERIYQTPEQLKQALQIGKAAPLDLRGRFVRAILVTGLGGSAIGGDFVRSYLINDLNTPLLVNRDYFLPAFVDEHCLVMVSSYSGNTEETLSAYEDARRKQAIIVCITSGGQLEARARQQGFPIIKIPGGSPPRAAFGYSVLSLLCCLMSSGLIGDQTVEIEKAIQLITTLRERYRRETATTENPAKQLALAVGDSIPLIYAPTTHYDAVATRWKGQICENGKRMAFANVFPELNHNEMVGWELPAAALKGLTVIMLRDRSAHGQVQKRMEITQEKIQSVARSVVEVWSEESSLLARLLAMVFLGDYVSYYLAMLSGVDPTPVAVIDDLKNRLQAK
ncbi:MAG: bifunctional phosphoglucose/phosphomannose isomerase [Acidobacteria bacterium]|nr:bifunctional phosphoglucose/phosphomannose isomerase [Acidobacteriota bacterium]MBI3657088.1 bifunctional phosphoglucose/phosphomannose isomerase [Acidobacteriota bacterium]